MDSKHQGKSVKTVRIFCSLLDKNKDGVSHKANIDEVYLTNLSQDKVETQPQSFCKKCYYSI